MPSSSRRKSTGSPTISLRRTPPPESCGSAPTAAQAASGAAGCTSSICSSGELAGTRLRPHLLDVGRRLEDRVLDRELEGHGRRGAALEQLDVAAVRAEVRAHAVERLAHPLLDRHGMQAVEQQQVRHELVVGQARQRAVVGPCHDVHDPLEALAVELEHRLHGLERRIARDRVGEGLQLAQEPLDPPDQLTIVHRLSRRRSARRTSASGPA